MPLSVRYQGHEQEQLSLCPCGYRIADSVLRLFLPAVTFAAGRTLPQLPFLNTNSRVRQRPCSMALFCVGPGQMAWCDDEQAAAGLSSVMPTAHVDTGGSLRALFITPAPLVGALCTGSP